MNLPLFVLLTACGAIDNKPPPPLEKLPDDADPSCAGKGECYMFGNAEGHCAGGCRMARDRQREAARQERALRAAPLSEAERAERRTLVEAHRAAEAAKAEAAAHVKAERAKTERLAATPEKTLRRRARLAARAQRS